VQGVPKKIFSATSKKKLGRSAAFISAGSIATDDATAAANRNTRCPEERTQAQSYPPPEKNVLKARGYSWSSGEFGRPECWYHTCRTPISPSAAKAKVAGCGHCAGGIVSSHGKIRSGRDRVRRCAAGRSGRVGMVRVEGKVALVAGAGGGIGRVLSVSGAKAERWSAPILTPTQSRSTSNLPNMCIVAAIARSPNGLPLQSPVHLSST